MKRPHRVFLYLGIFVLLWHKTVFAEVSCTVDYKIVNQWNNGFTAEVKITNLGDNLNGWTVSWNMPNGQVINGLWKGQHTQQGDSVEVINYDWNQNIATGSVIDFGFNASHEGTNDIPADITVNGVLCDGQVAPPPPPPPTNATCIVDYNISDQWNTGFTARITIQNTGMSLNGWNVTWTMIDSQQITNLWNGSLNQTGNSVSVTNLDWNKIIPTGGEIKFGFNGNYFGNNNKPNDLKVNGSRCEGQGAPPALDPPSTIALADNCAICHGTDGVSGGPSMPTITGFGKDYFIRTMTAYQTDARASNIMGLIARGYTEDQINLLADHFSNKSFVAAEQQFDINVVRRGWHIHKDRCVDCHSEGGRNKTLTGTILAGQWQTYLEATMMDYRAGRSSNIPADMAKQFEGLDNSSITALATYYAANMDDDELDDGSDTPPGSELYFQHQCLECHGTEGQGGTSGKALNHFTQNDYEYLVSTITNSMPLSDPAACDRQCAESITYYILNTFSGGADTGCQDNNIPTLPRRLRLLTRYEYQNTVNDLLGINTSIAAELPIDNRVAGFDNNSEQNIITDTRMDAYLSKAKQLSAQALRDNSDLLAICANTENCTEDLIRYIGKRAYRRPLTENEVRQYAGLFSSSATFEENAELMLTTMLVSPYFLYRSELGVEQADGSYKLTAYEIASSLSYLFWGTMPDEALFAAADTGNIDMISQATRLLSDQRSRTHLGHFAEQWLLSIDALSLDSKDPNIFPEFTPEVKDAMAEELKQFFNYVVFNTDGKYKDLFTDEYVIINRLLADYYNLSTPSGDDFEVVPVNDGTRTGILSLGSVLARYASSIDSSPIKRGVFLRERIMCQDIPLPGPDIDGTPPALDPNMTTRERFALHTEDPVCASCHKYIDEPGFGFGAYDGAAKFHTTENGQTIDASGKILGLENYRPDNYVEFNNLNEMSQILSQSDNAAKCIATQYYRFASGSAEEQGNCALEELQQRFTDQNYDLQFLLLEIVNSRHFTHRRAQ
jgi:cytochrome c553